MNMAISKEDRERFERQARDLAKIETDDPGTPEQRRAIIEFVSSIRVGRGGEALQPEHDDEEDEFPELEFFRRAESLGMARGSRNRT